MDWPSSTDSHGPVIISGVEPELTEEINAAYADMLEELGEIYYKNPFVLTLKHLLNDNCCQTKQSTIW